MPDLFVEVFGNWAPLIPQLNPEYAPGRFFYFTVGGNAVSNLGTRYPVNFYLVSWQSDFGCIDWPWVVGVFLFVLTLVSVFKLIGGVLGGR